MKFVTYGSEQARLNWRDMLDAALRGIKVIIERYGKPTVVMMSYDEFQELTRRAALSDPPSVMKARNDAEGTWVSQAEIDKSFGPLAKLRQLVETKEEWDAIIERAQRQMKNGEVQNGAEDENTALFAQIHQEIETLRQKALA